MADTFDPGRVRHALHAYDGDACRTADPAELAGYVVWVHADIARCYCPACVLARALLNLLEERAELATKAHARSSDPGTSHAAARSIHPDQLRDSQRSVLSCFGIYGPMHHNALVNNYDSTQRGHGWPLQSVSGLRTRTKELVEAGYLRDSGRTVRLPSGRLSIVWELNLNGDTSTLF